MLRAGTVGRRLRFPAQRHGARGQGLAADRGPDRIARTITGTPPGLKPVAGDRASWSGIYYATPADAGLNARDVTITSPAGPCPAWRIDATPRPGSSTSTDSAAPAPEHYAGSRLLGLPSPLRHYDWIARATELTAPMLILHGTRDTSVPLRLSRALRQRRPDHVTLQTFGADYTLTWNSDHERWQAVVRLAHFGATELTKTGAAPLRIGHARTNPVQTATSLVGSLVSPRPGSRRARKDQRG